MSRSTSTYDFARPISAAIRSVPIPVHPAPHAAPPPPQPFITISREPGAGGWFLAQQLVDALNTADPVGPPWTGWDRELVEKIAAEHHLSPQLVDSLENEYHSWITDFLGSLSFCDEIRDGDECMIYARVAATIRSLAQGGRVVIVGRGGVFITRHIPGGIHVRLIAPFEHRVAFMAQQLRLDHDAAAARVREIERNRNSFYRRYWPAESLGPETFTLTVNTAKVDAPTMIQMLKALVPQPAPVHAAAQP